MQLNPPQGSNRAERILAAKCDALAKIKLVIKLCLRFLPKPRIQARFRLREMSNQGLLWFLAAVCCRNSEIPCHNVAICTNKEDGKSHDHSIIPDMLIQRHLLHNACFCLRYPSLPNPRFSISLYLDVAVGPERIDGLFGEPFALRKPETFHRWAV